MNAPITLAVDVPGDTARVYDVLTTSEGQRGFWTPDCDVSPTRARFGFAQAPMDLEVDVTGEPGKLVRMHVTAGFPFWTGSTWEWELGPVLRAESGTGVLFRHYGFEAGYPEADLGHSAQTWASILDRLAAYVASGQPQPFLAGKES
jgi:hypothetical protein